MAQPENSLASATPSNEAHTTWVENFEKFDIGVTMNDTTIMVNDFLHNTVGLSMDWSWSGWYWDILVISIIFWCMGKLVDHTA